MQVDLCVFLAGLYLDEYTPLFFETLYKNCNTTDLRVHVVEKGGIHYTGPPQSPGEAPWYTTTPFEYYVPGVPDSVHKYLLEKKQELEEMFEIYEQHDPSVFFSQAQPCKPKYHYGDDHGNTLNWAMENCGNSKWVIFCHSDMVFRKDIISAFRNKMNDWTGMFGIYNHCYAVNREAFFKVGIKFNCLANFRVQKVKHSGYDYELAHASDPHCDLESAKIIYGFDVGELMEIMMIANAWECGIFNSVRRSPTDEEALWVSYVDHMCSGHGYVNEECRVYQRSRRQQWFDEFGIRKL